MRVWVLIWDHVYVRGSFRIRGVSGRSGLCSSSFIRDSASSRPRRLVSLSSHTSTRLASIVWPFALVRVGATSLAFDGTDVSIHDATRSPGEVYTLSKPSRWATVIIVGCSVGRVSADGRWSGTSHRCTTHGCRSLPNHTHKSVDGGNFMNATRTPDRNMRYLTYIDTYLRIYTAHSRTGGGPDAWTFTPIRLDYAHGSDRHKSRDRKGEHVGETTQLN